MLNWLRRNPKRRAGKRREGIMRLRKTRNTQRIRNRVRRKRTRKIRRNIIIIR